MGQAGLLERPRQDTILPRRVDRLPLLAGWVSLTNVGVNEGSRLDMDGAGCSLHMRLANNTGHLC